MLDCVVEIVCYCDINIVSKKLTLIGALFFFVSDSLDVCEDVDTAVWVATEFSKWSEIICCSTGTASCLMVLRR